MLDNLKLILLSIISSGGLLVAVWFKAKKQAKTELKVEQYEQIMEVQQKIDDAGHVSSDDIANKLRDGKF